ncbi:hypothetical protein [uncultured Algibacter sp.]|uniref:hypothetical protein n=1 Tax=uncultured Algibacter sp. TaxID=298659 RepID=UPI00262766FE|nr:hypothetical protein [uncultured Algibacter sp.]
MHRNLIKVILIFTVLFSTNFNSYGQSSDHEINLIQELFGLEKTEMLINLLGDVNDEFWPIYKDYESKRMTLGKVRLQLIEDYAKSYDTLTDDKINELLKDTQTQSKNIEKLINKYTTKVKKASGPKVAAQFYQLETYLLAAVRVKIMESIPLIGELDPEY